VTFRPFTVARWGVYLAVAAAVMSAWLGQRAGASLDFVLMRGVFVFVVFAGLGFAAEAVLTVGFVPPAPRPDPSLSAGEHPDE
jgi:hypothetical protein